MFTSDNKSWNIVGASANFMVHLHYPVSEWVAMMKIVQLGAERILSLNDIGTDVLDDEIVACMQKLEIYAKAEAEQYMQLPIKDLEHGEIEIDHTLMQWAFMYACLMLVAVIADPDRKLKPTKATFEDLELPDKINDNQKRTAVVMLTWVIVERLKLRLPGLKPMWDTAESLWDSLRGVLVRAKAKGMAQSDKDQTPDGNETLTPEEEALMKGTFNGPGH